MRGWFARVNTGQLQTEGPAAVVSQITKVALSGQTAVLGAMLKSVNFLQEPLRQQWGRRRTVSGSAAVHSVFVVEGL